MASLATADDMRDRYDERRLGDLCSDTGVRVNPEDIAASTQMVTALSSASGRVLASLLRGNIYTAADIAALPAESLAFVVDIVCVIAYYNLVRRKHAVMDDDMYKLAKDDYDNALKDLRSGDLTLDLAPQNAAGVVDSIGVSKVSAPDFRLISDRARGRLLPARRTYNNE